MKSLQVILCGLYLLLMVCAPSLHLVSHGASQASGLGLHGSRMPRSCARYAGRRTTEPKRRWMRTLRTLHDTRRTTDKKLLLLSWLDHQPYAEATHAEDYFFDGNN